MVERKQRINVTLSPDTLNELEERIPEKQRSSYIEDLIRKDLGMPEATNAKQGFAAYTRDIDYGQGIQTVYVNDGKIVSQSIGPRPGLYHSYTGDGNPEWIGQDVNAIYGQGFKRLRGRSLEHAQESYLQNELEDY